MHLLVTGGCGFIGSHFIRYWRTQHPNDSITNLDALTYAGNLANLADIPTNDPCYQFIHGTICEADTVHRAFENIDFVVHFAAETHVDRSIQGSRVFLETNILGTHTLLEEARRRGSQIKRFHAISTDEVFGSLALDEPQRFTESTRYQPRSPYSASKAAEDHLCLAYHETHGVPITLSNCSNNYGPNLFPEKFIPLAITNLIQGKPIPVYGEGKNIRDWLHVTDHCRAIEAILLRGTIGESYNIGGDAEYQNIDIAKMIVRAFQKDEASSIQFVTDRKGHDLRYAIDHSKITRELGWEPSISFEKGLTEMIDWYTQNESWWRPLLTKATLT